MAEDNGKEEEKFDFTAEGEGYISLDEARILAMQTASSVPGDYGRSFRGVTMVFEVASLEETDDFYEVTLSFRPQGNFDGTPGQEQFFIGKEGTIAFRQVHSFPIQTFAPPTDNERRGGFPIIPVGIGLVVVGIIAAVGAILLISSSGGDSVPVAVVAPTATPAPTDTPVPTETLAPTQAPAPTKTPVPTETLAPTQAPAPTETLAPPTPTFTPTPFPTRTPRPTATNTPNTRTARIVFNRAETTLKGGHYQGAIREYTTAIEFDPNYAAAYFGRALAYQSLGQHTLADADKAKACSLDSQYC